LDYNSQREEKLMRTIVINRFKKVNAIVWNSIVWFVNASIFLLMGFIKVIKMNFKTTEYFFDNDLGMYKFFI
jgi:hypothetical protein